VSFDFGATRELDALRQRALAAGAIRAHVLDVREEFARDCVLPALRSRAAVQGKAIEALAEPLIAAKLNEIATIEHADVAALKVVAQRFSAAEGRTLKPSAESAAHVELEFVNGVPTAINNVPMRLVELLESLTTIAAGHGIGTDDLYAPASSALQAAYAAADAATFTGTVQLKLSGGMCAVDARLPVARA